VLVRGGWSTQRPELTLLQEIDPASVVQEVGCTPGTVWTGAENLDTTRIRFPERPAHNESLQRYANPTNSVVKDAVDIANRYGLDGPVIKSR
jgi:hypothetical protein